jgi:hypothetical protein
MKKSQLPYYFSLRLALHKFPQVDSTGTNYTLKHSCIISLKAMLTTDMVDYIPTIVSVDHFYEKRNYFRHVF